MRYRAFLSYSHADRKWAKWLRRKIESYRVPGNVLSDKGQALPKRLIPVFRDRDELPSVASLSDAVTAALTESECLIVVCSPNAVNSRWVNEEIRIFRDLGRSEKIYSFLVAGDPTAGAPDYCFPDALTAPAQPGGPHLEPVAADARAEGDGRSNAALKIIASMLGVGFDALKQRALHQRHRRLIAVTVASLAITAITVGLAIVATNARIEADSRRSQAEDLVDFMLGDLQEPLNEIGRLDILEKVGGKAFDYFSGLTIDDGDDHTMSQRARNLRQIGEVKLDQGDMQSAMQAFVGSLALTTPLAERNPMNAAIQLDHAHSYFYIGLVHWNRGELEPAAEYFERVLPIVDGISTREPENTTWLLERGYAYTNLGRIHELEGALERALAAYTIVMSINVQLVELEPENLDSQLELGYAHNNIGKLVTAMGRLEEAGQHYRKDLELKAHVFALNPGLNYWRAAIASSEYFLGQHLITTGSYAEAEEHLMQAVLHYQLLEAGDTENTEWINRRANATRELGRLYSSVGREEQASEMLTESTRSLELLSNGDRDNSIWRRDLVKSLLRSSDAAFSRGENSRASADLLAAERHLSVLLDQEPGNKDTQQLSIYADIRAARVQAFTDSAKAAASYEKVLEKIDAQFFSSSEPFILESRYTALAGLGLAQEAKQVRDQLSAMGYAGVRDN